MAECAEMWQRNEAEKAIRRVEAEVARAIAEFNANHRERFWMLERMTGLEVPGGATPTQREMHRKLAEVCNGNDTREIEAGVEVSPAYGLLLEPHDEAVTELA